MPTNNLLNLSPYGRLIIHVTQDKTLTHLKNVLNRSTEDFLLLYSCILGDQVDLRYQRSRYSKPQGLLQVIVEAAYVTITVPCADAL